MELVVCVKESTCRCRPGEILEAKPNGWQWSMLERINDIWKIITVDITEIEAAALMSTVSGNTKKMNIMDLPDTLTRDAFLARVLP